MYGAVQRLAQITGDRQPGDDLGRCLVQETEGVQLAQPNPHLFDQDATTAPLRFEYRGDVAGPSENDRPADTDRPSPDYAYSTAATVMPSRGVRSSHLLERERASG